MARRLQEARYAIGLPVPARVAFRVWAEVERYPEWMDHLVSVERIGPRTSVWTMERLDGGLAKWTTETTMAEPPRTFAWSSLDGDLVTYGHVELEAQGQRTRMRVRRFHGSGRRQRSLTEGRFGDPQAKLRQDMEGFVRQLRKVHEEMQVERAAERAVRPQATWR